VLVAFVLLLDVVTVKVSAVDVGPLPPPPLFEGGS